MPYRKFKETIRKHKLIEPGDRILVAFSGGPDSTVLLHFLFLFSQEFGYSLAVAHLNHGLRKEADDEEEFCKARAEEYDLHFVSKKLDVRKYAKEKGLNIEEAARKLRYSFLEETTKELSLKKIATGHTLSDQAETLFYRLIRGSGISGLSGIHPLREGKYIRPLLFISRKEILEFLQRTSIPYIQDPSNYDISYDRNWIRHKLFPFIEERFPWVQEVLSREAMIFYQENQWIEEIIQKELEERLRAKKLLTENWETLNAGFKRRLVREFLRKMRGDLRRINFDHIEHILGLTPGQQYFLPGGERAMRLSNSLFYLGRLPKVKQFSLKIEGEGEYEIKDLWKMKIRKFKGHGDFARNDIAYVSGIKFPITVRNWREGDKYMPIGAEERRKLSNIFNSRKVPGPLRKFFPVFISEQQIFWAYLIPVSEKFRFNNEGFFIEIKPLLDIFQL